MKKITLLLACLMLSFQAFSQASNYNVGDVVNDFTVTDTDGVDHNLYGLIDAGKYVYLDFFFDTCGPCQANQPTFNEFIDKYGCNMGDVYGLSINNGTDNNQEVIDYVNTYGGPWVHPPAVSSEGGGGAVTADFGVSAFPTFVLIGPGYTMLNRDIWPLSGIGTFEDTFPAGFDPPVNYCTVILGVDEMAFDLGLQVYPNPNSGSEINIKLNNEVTSADVKIFTVLGSQVYSNRFASNIFLINAELASGSYLVSVTTDKGASTVSLIVE
mgnify:CR=1 FL=1